MKRRETDEFHFTLMPMTFTELLAQLRAANWLLAEADDRRDVPHEPFRVPAALLA